MVQHEHYRRGYRVAVTFPPSPTEKAYKQLIRDLKEKDNLYDEKLAKLDKLIKKLDK